MIHEVEGDVLEALVDGDIDVLAHGVNCCDAFGSGIAGQIAREFPHVKEAYHRKYSKYGIALGEVDIVPVTTSYAIANCATQQLCGGEPKKQPLEMYCSYDAIKECMIELREKYKCMDTSIGMPYIGAGLAGGNWNTIKSIITEVFEKSNSIDVYLYKYKK